MIGGLASDRKLERHVHLEKVVNDFFKNILGLEVVPFDEAERISEPQGPGFKSPSLNFLGFFY